VEEVVRQCASHRVPLIAFGTGTSLEGHLNAPFGGISIDLSRMDAIRAVHAEDLDCSVEPGVTRTKLNSFIRDQGLFFPIDPGADASLGGMAATRASGTNAVRYGTMKDAVLALTVVMPNGEVVRTARRAKKSSSGYDLTRLLVGSEGTLGIITELTLRLYPIPEAIAAAVCGFETLAAKCFRRLGRCRANRKSRASTCRRGSSPFAVVSNRGCTGSTIPTTASLTLSPPAALATSSSNCFRVSTFPLNKLSAHDALRESKSNCIFAS
jgi:FAD/FMN-containing dehydrogenase